MPAPCAQHSRVLHFPDHVICLGLAWWRLGDPINSGKMLPLLLESAPCYYYSFYHIVSLGFARFPATKKISGSRQDLIFLSLLSLVPRTASGSKEA